MYIDTHAHVNVHLYTCECVCVYMCAYMYMYACFCVLLRSADFCAPAPCSFKEKCAPIYKSYVCVVCKGNIRTRQKLCKCTRTLHRSRCVLLVYIVYVVVKDTTLLVLFHVHVSFISENVLGNLYAYVHACIEDRCIISCIMIEYSTCWKATVVLIAFGYLLV